MTSRISEQRIADALRRQAASPAPAVPPALHARILQAVASVPSAAPDPHPSLPVPLWLPAAAAALAILLGAWWLATTPARHAGETPAITRAVPSSLAPQPLLPFDALSETLRAWSGSPFHPEAAALQRDLADAGEFLLACVGTPP